MGRFSEPGRGVRRRKSGSVIPSLPPWAACVLALVPLWLGCTNQRGRGPAGPGVLVIAVDGLRADHLSALDYDRPTTPMIDALAADGVLFRQAFATAPLLLPSHVSLFTGCHPMVARRFRAGQFEGLAERRWLIPEAAPHLAIEYLARGFATAAFVDDPILARVHGFGPGFQSYQTPAGEGGSGGSRARRQAARLLQWLRSRRHADAWFGYVHLTDLESSWTEPDPAWDHYFPARPIRREVPPVGNADSTFFAIPFARWRGGARSLGQYEASYDGHLRGLDLELGELFAELRRMGRFENTTVVLVGTHGVQFGESGLYLRSGRYSLADLRVPVVVRPRRELLAPGDRGRQVDGLFSLVDVAPTLLELEGWKTPELMEGVSHAARIRSSEASDSTRTAAFASCGMQEGFVALGERFCLEFLQPRQVADPLLRRSWFGARVGRSSLPEVRFYDRRSDPFPPLVPLAEPPTDEAFRELSLATAAWIADLERKLTAIHGEDGPSLGFDPAALATLRQQGFLEGGP